MDSLIFYRPRHRRQDAVGTGRLGNPCPGPGRQGQHRGGGEEEERSERAREARANGGGESARKEVRYHRRKVRPDGRFVGTNIYETTDASLHDRRREGP